MLLVPLILCLAAATTQSFPLHPQFHVDECVALLEFRGNFSVEPHYALRKLRQWKIEGKSGNCCGWDGVECDDKDGHVVGLDLSNTGFHGSIDSRSSLFRLLHLQKLNLGDVFLGSSRIPPSIGKLSRLTTLNLSFCGFQAPIPSEFFGLTNLTSLDLSDSNFINTSDIENLVVSLNKLEVLRLSYLNLPSGLPDAIGNLSSLRSLIVDHSYLQGGFPIAIFKLPKLEYLDVSANPWLSGYFPEFHSGSPLKSISASFTNFSGKLPPSLGNLGSLSVLDISSCYFWGSVPSSLSNLKNLSILRLSNNNFHGPIPSLVNLSNLTSLELSKNQFYGDILSTVGNGVERLDLSYNNFTGDVSDRFVNRTRLVYLDLASNRFHGRVQLDSLLHRNQNLRILRLQFNNLSVIANSDDVTSISPSTRLRDVQLAYCDLREFPKVLQNQTELFRLDLSSNNMKGTIPVWFKNISTESLVSLNLSHNSLTGFVEENETVHSGWRILGSLDLRYNELQGSLLAPPPSIFDYLVSNNKLTGEITPEFCNCSNIQTLDLSNNRLSGTIPKCLSKSDGSLRILSLHGNNLSGTIPPQLFQSKCLNLQIIDFSDNQLEGSLPTSLSSCVRLTLLNFGGNNIRDTFPSWLGSLSYLRVLILRSNEFHGEIAVTNDGGSGFRLLHIVDLSQNDFTGYLPARHIDGWESMKAGDQEQPAYLQTTLPSYLTYDRGVNDDSPLFLDGLTTYDLSMRIVNKGSEMEYEKILNYLMVVDFSSNKFTGWIPGSIGTLERLHQLNLSNNALTGPIPPFLGALMKLEALDLSHNNLSGQIPKELTQLNFLAVFNVSYNNLSGEIPQGSQFGSFSNSSYVDNEGLCGVPMSSKCNNVGLSLPPPPPPPSPSQKSVILEWKAVAVGYASSFIISAIIGDKIIKRGTRGRRTR